MTYEIKVYNDNVYGKTFEGKLLPFFVAVYPSANVYDE